MAKVLLVDDEEVLRLMMGRQLRRAGHEVTFAEDGLAAVGLLEKETFDVVVTDMKMPRLDGMALLDRAMKMAPDTEFIILTGHGSMENAVEAFKTGNVFDYLVKPLEDIRELDAMVARAAERHRLRCENIRLVAELEGRIRELETTRQKLADLALRDSLTGLLNHRAMHDRLRTELQSDQETPLAVMLVDMDDFKRLNDVYGHPVGDQVLRHIAGTLQWACDDGAFLGRCGGDEFMIVLPGATARDAGKIADCARQRLAALPFRTAEGTALPLRLSFGIADVTSAGRSPLGLLAAADAALYESKRHGGDTVTLHMVSPDGIDTVNRTAFDVLDGLVTAIDKKDRYTRAHSELVTLYALQLAEALLLSEETCNALRLAGLLHDVGKIGIPDSILRKPGRLTPAEYEVMKSHVTISALILHGLPRLADILDAVANHHERWDGKGYPRGLAGEQIPLLGRIMAIADAFSAMSLDRPYRPALPTEQALEEIERGAGSQFDPELARVFVETIRTNPSTREQAAQPAA